MNVPVDRYPVKVTPRDAAGTRAKILGVARELFLAQGYAGTSIADIAGRLGVTKGALYYHFESKEQILDALVAEPAAALSRIAELASQRPPLPPADILAAVIDLQADHPAAYLTLLTEDPSLRGEYEWRHDFEGKNSQIIAALAGPSPRPAGLIRARMAVTAAKAGATDALRLGHGRLPPDIREEILAAALGALGP